MSVEIYQADSSVEWLSLTQPIKLVWTDPPFGTGKKQSQRGSSYNDLTEDRAIETVVNSMRIIRPYLAHDAVVCICADYRIIHDIAVELKKFLYLQGEVIWQFGLGRPRQSWWPNRHNTIITMTTTKDQTPFDFDSIPVVKRKAPKPGYPATKPIGSVWDKTMSNTDPERVGYPNQKPLSIVRPFIRAHTNPDDIVADPFMGSGTTGHAATMLGRKFIGQDLNKQSIEVVNRRLNQ